MSISQHGKKYSRPSEVLWVWDRRLPAKKAQVGRYTDLKVCLDAHTAVGPGTPYRAQPKPTQISLEIEKTGLEPCNLGQLFFFFLNGAHSLGICLKKSFIPRLSVEKWFLFI